MNEMVPVTTQSYGLVPTSMGEAMRLAEMMASSKLVPVALQKAPADCLMVIQQAVRWQLDPFAVAQECSVIQGKLMHSGKLVAAVVNARGGLADRLSFAYEGEGDKRAIIVSGRVQGEEQPRTVKVNLRDAKTANGMWTKQPDQQLMYHGARVWARRHTPELMLGIQSPEEFDEAAIARSGTPLPPARNIMLPAHDSSTGEVIEHDALAEVLSAAEKATAVQPPTTGDRLPAENPAPSATVTGQAAAQTGAGIDTEETSSERAARLDKVLQQAATKGMTELQGAWNNLTPDDKTMLKSALDKRHKVTAKAVDQIGEPA